MFLCLICCLRSQSQIRLSSAENFYPSLSSTVSCLHGTILLINAVFGTSTPLCEPPSWPLIVLLSLVPLPPWQPLPVFSYCASITSHPECWRTPDLPSDLYFPLFSQLRRQHPRLNILQALGSELSPPHQAETLALRPLQAWTHTLASPHFCTSPPTGRTTVLRPWIHFLWFIKCSYFLNMRVYSRQKLSKGFHTLDFACLPASSPSTTAHICLIGGTLLLQAGD